MERPTTKPPGTPLDQLDTPALILDLDRLDANIAAVRAPFRAGSPTLRADVEAHRCPVIARRQLAAGGAAGIAVSGLAQAAHFAAHGFDDILVTTEILSSAKLARLAALGRHGRITVLADSPSNLQRLAEAATTAGATLRVLVEIASGLASSGVEPAAAPELARAANDTPSVHCDGVAAFLRGPTAEEREPAAVGPVAERLAEARAAMEKEGIRVETVSLGGLLDPARAVGFPGLTEVVAGGYALSDLRHQQARPELQPAIAVLATVISRPEPALAVLDLGQKAMGADTALPQAGLPGATLFRMNAEHGYLALADATQESLDLGAKVRVIPWDAAGCLNMYDYINVIRNGRLEAVWEISARGIYR